MESIAMKMTQKEFDSIKELINLPIDLNSNDFKEYCWVTNDRNREGVVTNLMHANNPNYDRKVYEYFDKNIFLKACDVEVEKVWKGSDMQYLFNGIWTDCKGYENYEYRLKPQPNYSKEIESLQEKAKENGMKVELIWSEL